MGNILSKISNINLFEKERSKILVLSGGGFRGVYTLGILKGLEELGIDKNISIIYGVSIGAIIGALRSNGLKAQEIFDILESISLEKLYNIDLLKKTGGIFSNKKIEKILEKHLPKKFSELQKKLYIGATDANTAKYILFNKGNLIKIILGSMAIPGIFPATKYKNYNLVDGGILNNFPVDLAKEKYPNHDIIGIALNKFEKNQEITSTIKNILVTFEIILRAKLLENTKLVKHLFYRKIPISTLSLDKKKMEEIYTLGYNDCIKKFK